MKARAILVACLVFTYPLCQLHAELAGVLHLKGTVWSNGSPARDGSVIGIGDRIQTGEESYANVSSGPGNSITVAASSSAVYGARSVRLESGAALLSGRELLAEIAGMKAFPSGKGPGQILVHADREKIEIAAVKGDALVQDGAISYIVPEGKVATRSRSGSAPAVAMNNFAASPALIAILTGAAAAGVVTGVIVTSDDRKTISPSLP